MFSWSWALGLGLLVLASRSWSLGLARLVFAAWSWPLSSRFLGLSDLTPTLIVLLLSVFIRVALYIYITKTQTGFVKSTFLKILVVIYIEKSTPSAKALAIFFCHSHYMLMVMSAYLVTSTTITILI